MTGDAPHLTRRQHRRVARAVAQAERTTGVQFCVYLGPTGADSRAHAETMFEEAGLHTRPAVLLLIAPAGRRLEVVTAPELRDRLRDQTCADIVAEMTDWFGRSDIAGGIVAGLERLQAAVGPATGETHTEPFPDLIED